MGNIGWLQECNYWEKADGMRRKGVIYDSNYDRKEGKIGIKGYRVVNNRG